MATGLLHALGAMDMPSPGSVSMSQGWRFPRPVYIGDTIRAEATVRSVRDDKPISEIRFEIVSQEGEQILKGRAMLFRGEPER